MEWTFEDDSAEDDLDKTLEIRQVTVFLFVCVCCVFLFSTNVSICTRK